MGHFVDGEWLPGFYSSDSQGRFERPPTTFHGSLETTEAGRYHLYFSYACPWAHRTLIARSMLGLQEVISASPVHWLLTDDGWAFREECTDPLHEAHFLRELYVKADPRYTGRVTVPVLWDKRESRIVNNESRLVLRQLCARFDGGERLSPPAQREAIDAMIDRIYNPVNNGVYRCGFANSQLAYDEAAGDLYAELDRLEEHLGDQPYLCGDALTEADICLFTTLLRFDPVYSVHFKCSRRRIADYANLWRFTQAVHETPGVAETCRLDHIRNHYYQSHRHINPTGIVAELPYIIPSAWR